MSFAPIAIIGRACILPGALTPDAFYARLRAGHSLLGAPHEARWRLDPDLAIGDHPDRSWSDVGGYVHAPDLSPDPDALKIDPARLAALDPLTLWTITCAQDALRDASLAAGRPLEPNPARAGTIWGNLSFPSESLSRLAERAFLDQLGPALSKHIPLAPAAPEDRFMSGLPALLCAEALGFRGPAFCIDAACASSLYAIQLACRELHSGRADLMIAGAVQRADSLFLHVGFSALQALSKRGQSRPFHPEADGLIPAEGAACVVLRRLDDAVRDGDRILGVIRGVGLSNDGRGRGFLAPSIDGQQLAIRSAYQQADLSPADIDYVECHATGTLLGDRTELDSMAGVFPVENKLLIGSHKSNLGHAITAAGMAGLLKVLGALEHHVIPPTIGLTDATPVADPDRFEIVRAPRAWEPSDRPRRAAVSAFGFGGNNAHLIVEEFTGHVPVPPAAQAAPARIAVVGLGVVAGSCDGRAEFARVALADQPAAPSLAGVTVDLDGLRTPPADLERAQGMQLATLRAAQEAIAGLDLDGARTGALIGMGCDPEVARYGVRWRLNQWAARWREAGLAVPQAWLGAAQDAALPMLNAAGVIGAMPNIPANRLNHALGLNGPSYTTSAEELSGVVALRIAIDSLRARDLDHVLVGAAEVTSHDPTHINAIRALMPEDRQQCGDAAIVLVLERLEDARAAGREILATIDLDGGAAVTQRWSLDAAPDHHALTPRLGHAHAASGLLHVGAAVLGAHHRAQPGAQPWLVDDATHRARVTIRSALARAEAHVTVQAEPGHSAPLVAHPLARQPLDAPAPREREGKLAFVFSGAGAAYRGQGRALMLATPWVQRALTQRGLRAQATAACARWATGEQEAEPHRSPAEVQVLATSWLSQYHATIALEGLGLKPEVMIGHSLGEVSALFASGAWGDADVMADELLASQLFSRDLAGRHEAARRDWFSGGFRELATQSGPVWGCWAVQGPVAPALALAKQSSLAHVTAIHTDDEWLLGGWPQACHELLAALEAEHPGVYRHAQLAYDASIHCPEVVATRPAWRTLHHRALGEPSSEVWSQRYARPHDMRAGAIADALEAQAEHTADFPTLINAAWEAGARTFLVCGPQALPARWITQTLGDRAHAVISLDLPGQDDLTTLDAALRQLGATPSDALRAALWPDVPRSPARPLRCALRSVDAAALSALGDTLSAQRFEQDTADITISTDADVAIPTHADVTIGTRRDQPKMPSASPERGPQDRAKREPRGPSAAAMIQPSVRRPEAERTVHQISNEPSVHRPEAEKTVRQTSNEPSHKIPMTFVMSPAPALGSALAQRQLAPETLPTAEAPMTDVSHETPPTHEPAWSGVAAIHIDAQRQLGAMQQRLIAAQQAAYLDTLAAQQRSLTQLAHAFSSRAPAEFIAPAPAAPVREPGDAPMGPGGALTREQLEYLSWGQVSRVFGALFAPQDDHAVQTRMPRPPLLLCDRVLSIDAEAGSMRGGTIVTETDVTWDAWYLHDGRMSPGIMIESGQADLLLVSYLGIDLQHPGDRAYRLLGCELTYMGEAPRVGEILHYEITIDGWAKHGEVILFFFHYDCTVNGELRLRVRDGQAGFFTEAELAESGGVLWTPADHIPDPAARVDAPSCLSASTKFSREALDAFSLGHPERCFGEGFERALAQVRPPRIPHGNRLLLDRVLRLEAAGGPWGRGYLLAEADVSPDDWFFDGHFHNDPCMPGTLMFDVCTQAMAFYMAALGMTLDHDGWRFEPVPGSQYAMRCRGQVTPTSRLVTYELFVEEVWSGPVPTLWADLLVTVDGLKAFHCKRMGLQLVPGTILDALPHPPAPDQPFDARPHPASHATSRAVSPLHNQPVWPASYAGDPTYRSIAALALGRHSEAFGPAFGVFDGLRRAAHMPGPPYLFMTRVASVDQPSDQFQAGVTAQIGYDLPADAWYFSDNGDRVMPYGVFMEVALQPCGWLSTWVGSMMRSERDMSYRNLDGKATLYRIPTPGEGELITTTKLIKNAMSGGMILQTFLVNVSLGDEVIYELETVFGFFPPEALAQQVGLPASDEDRAWVVSRCDDFTPVELGRGGEAPAWHGARLPGGRLLMVDRVTGWWPQGGRFGRGKWRAVIDVAPDDWFFRSHFFRDPVQPGSLGVEALFQLLQHAIMHHHALPPQARFESVALGVEHVWRYRGQVTPDHREVVLELDLERIDEEPNNSLLATAHAWLWAGGKRIYEVQGLAVRVWLG